MIENGTKESSGWSFKSIYADLADAMLVVYENNQFINKFVDIGNKK